MRIQHKYGRLWAFFEGAFQTNSGGHAKDSDFKAFTDEQMARAEKELEEFCVYINAYALGCMADSGYTVWGQTMQEEPEGQGDDEQHVLEAFNLLNTRY